MHTHESKCLDCAIDPTINGMNCSRRASRSGVSHSTSVGGLGGGSLFFRPFCGPVLVTNFRQRCPPFSSKPALPPKSKPRIIGMSV
eukprot:9484708-Pyramimonas_sp.AAC.2